MACTDIHTTPTKLIKALLNPNISIRLNGIKKSGGGGGGMPTPRIVYDSTTIHNTASLAIEDFDNDNSTVDGKALAACGGGENNRRTVLLQGLYMIRLLLLILLVLLLEKKFG